MKQAISKADKNIRYNSQYLNSIPFVLLQLMKT